MSELNAEDTTRDEAQTHRLLTLLTVTGLNLGMLQRELDKSENGASAKTRVLVERITQTHRSIIDELRLPHRNE